MNEIKQNGSKPVALALRGVGKSFSFRGRNLEVLRDISLDVYAGEIVCFVGPSGCGKTTLLGIAAGLDQPSCGQVSHEGQVVTNPCSARCLIFQKPSLFPWLTVKKNVSLGLDIRGDKSPDRSARIKSVINLVGLDGFEDYMPSQLSGGMAQRVALARALVNRPKLLLLDEPFAALDAVTRGRMQEELLKILKTEGCTAIFITHDLEEAIFLGSRIVLMKSGPGRIDSIFEVPLTQPRSKTSREFMAFRAEISESFFAIGRDNKPHSREELPMTAEPLAHTNHAKF